MVSQVYEMESPRTGKMYQIDAPAGATPDQARARLKQRIMEAEGWSESVTPVNRQKYAPGTVGPFRPQPNVGDILAGRFGTPPTKIGAGAGARPREETESRPDTKPTGKTVRNGYSFWQGGKFYIYRGPSTTDHEAQKITVGNLTGELVGGVRESLNPFIRSVNRALGSGGAHTLLPEPGEAELREQAGSGLGAMVNPAEWLAGAAEGNVLDLLALGSGAKGLLKGLTPKAAATAKAGAKPKAPKAPQAEQPTPKPGAGKVVEGAGGEIGIAQRIRLKRESEGKPSFTQTGTVAEPEELVRFGEKERKALGVQGTQARMSELETTKSMGEPKDLALFRAELRRLAAKTNKTEDAWRANPRLKPAYDKAFAEEREWSKRIKPFQTKWGEYGRAQQGAQEIDTGTFSGIRRAFEDKFDRPMTVNEEGVASGHAARVTKLETENARLQSELDKALKATAEKMAPGKGVGGKAGKLPKDEVGLKAHFAERIKSGSLFQTIKQVKQAGAVSPGRAPNFTTEEVRAIWGHAKTKYLDQGQALNFDALSEVVGRDLGLETDWVKRAFAAPKQVRTLTAEQYRVAFNRRRAIAEARQWVEGADTSKLVKAISEAYEIPRTAMASVDQSFGGRQGWFFNAGDLLWGTRSFAKHTLGEPTAAFWSKPWAEAAMQRMERHPMFDEALQDGLTVSLSPTHPAHEIFQSRLLLSEINPELATGARRKLGEFWNQANPYARSETSFEVAGNALRLDKYAEARKWLQKIGRDDPETRKALAKAINIATAGEKFEVHGGAAQFFTKAFWSTKLMKTQLATINPVWYAKQPKGVRRYMVTQMAKNLSVIAGIATAAKTAANEFGIDSDVELRPWESDFGKLRYGNQRVSLMGGRENMIRTIYRAVTDSAQGKTYDVSRELGNFVRYRAHPTISGGTQVISGKDVFGKEKPPLESGYEMLTPMIFQDIRDAYKNGTEKDRIALAAMITILSNYGISAQAYEKSEKGEGTLKLEKGGGELRKSSP